MAAGEAGEIFDTIEGLDHHLDYRVITALKSDQCIWPGQHRLHSGVSLIFTAKHITARRTIKYYDRIIGNARYM